MKNKDFYSEWRKSFKKFSDKREMSYTGTFLHLLLEGCEETETDMARRLGYTQGYISMYFTKNKDIQVLPSRKFIYKLAKEYQLNTNELGIFMVAMILDLDDEKENR